MLTREARQFTCRLLVGLMYCLVVSSRAQAQVVGSDQTHQQHQVNSLQGETGAWHLETDFAIESMVDADHSPRGALWRSAAFPGWGQYYNRQIYKMPFVYGALGGLLYTAFTKHDDYILYREAYQYKAFQELVDAGVREDNPRSSFKPSYDRIVAEFGPVSSSPLRTQRNNFRRTRDLSLIGSGVVYGLAMLDAYVSAHLLDFDIGDDLSFTVIPLPSGVRLSARMQISNLNWH